MNTTLTCPECGKPVAPNNLRGICPECMMKVGLSPQTAEAGPGGTLVVNSTPPPSPAEIARLFPQLEILGLLGSGGMGAIYNSGTNAFLDLDSGQFVSYTGPKLDSGKIPQGRIDLYYRPTLSALDDLATVGMVCVSIAKGQAAWTQPPSPATICTLLDEAAKRSGSGGEAIFSPSTIHAFRTHDGAMGLLQSLGANDDSGIRVRYCLITNNVAVPAR